MLTPTSIEMPATSLFVARAEPYRVSDLNRFMDEIKASPLVKIGAIGKTVQGRDLEIIRVGRDVAPNRVFIRARAHPWEPVGNWVVEGLVRRLLKGDADAEKFLARYSVCILPMANKDGVERGGTRFNSQGWDLNRKWDKPADPQFAPENAALERWLDAEIKAGRRPSFAMDLHNDANGMLHISRPDIPDIEKYLERMAHFEQCLRDHTWFTVGSTKPTFHNPGTLGEGWFQRFGIDAVILEFNCNYIESIKEPALGRHWMTFGHGLVAAFDERAARVRGQPHDAGDVLGGQQPRRVDRQARAAGRGAAGAGHPGHDLRGRAVDHGRWPRADRARSVCR